MNQPIIDVNVNLSRWPTRRIREDETPVLVSKLKSHGVRQAWAGSLDGLLHKDLAAVNERLASQCSSVRDLQLLPIGSINPLSPNWQEDVRRCAELHRMRGVRVHPNYHGYKLDHPNFAELLKLCAAKRLMLMLPIQMEDERVMHPLLRVKPVDVTFLTELMPQVPELKLVILNAGKGLLPKVSALVRNANVSLDIANLDGLAVIEDALRDIPLNRLLFGSHAPLFYFESALLKLKEAELTQAATQRIMSSNAEELLK